jgi:DNA topoisomerase-6 subunit B
MLIDVIKNEPHIITQDKEKNEKKWRGIKIELYAKGRYIESSQSIVEYLRQTAIMNPYAKIVFKNPSGEKQTFSRVVDKLPKRPKEIKPHPYGVEVGILRRMIHGTKAKHIQSFLMRDFSRVGKKSATEILKIAKINSKTKAQNLSHDDITRLHKSMHRVKLIAPPTDCLSPVGEEYLLKGLKKEINAEHYVSVSRSPVVYRGMPFSVECALAYGGDLESKKKSQILRFANKVPLLYNQRDCAITKSVIQTDWKRYGISQSSNSLPNGPIAILIQFVSVWVPYTSEGKQAIASYPEIIKEIKLTLQDAGRKMKLYISRRKKRQQMKMRQDLFEKYIPEVSEGIEKISGTSKQKIIKDLEKMLDKGVDENGEEN